MWTKIKYLGLCVALAGGVVSCSYNTQSQLTRNTAEAYSRQQYLDNRMPVPLTADTTSPLHDVQVKSDGLSYNTMKF